MSDHGANNSKPSSKMDKISSEDDEIDIEDDEDEYEYEYIEDEPKSRWLYRTVMTGMFLLTFGVGVGTGIIVDGNAYVLKGYEKRAETKQRSPQTIIAQNEYEPQNEFESVTPVSDDTAVETGVEYPANNAVSWSITVAPGTPVSDLVVKNNSPTKNSRIDLRIVTPTGRLAPVASVWVQSRQNAVVTLPFGRYMAAARIDDKADLYIPSSNPNQRINGQITVSRVANGDSPPVISSDSMANFKIGNVKAKSTKEIGSVKPTRAPIPRKIEKETDYEDLGDRSIDGGNPTYGN